MEIHHRKKMNHEPTKIKHPARNKGVIIFWILFSVAFAALLIVKLYFYIITFF
jgi:hypothetical protein